MATTHRRRGPVAAEPHPDPQTTFFYPNRCEYPDCTAPARTLRTCTGCEMVRYCSPEHQKADWNAHKRDCKTFSRLGITASFYSDEEMLAKHPIRTRAELAHWFRTAAQVGSKCEICGVDDGEVDMILTDCCGATVCDSEDDLSGANRCPRYHERYTLCGYHGVENWCDKNADWRNCAGCKRGLLGNPNEVADVLYRGLSMQNTTPLLSADVPRHSMCDTCGICKKSFMSGLEGFSYSGTKRTCMACSFRF
ncbi:hypothetical protein BCR44DRAFT_52903 [Catenaria anguillulae PL171]|uniref:MYND-type domain-containing protein n=1 Tax=Catenaria anguillulae PL171 TaxID=765915 RepID=A0A1Y2I0W6_9FUNG|nr:hypothetical protein BCR44DRAFT_52903 [Catenaria anguillulae PL171]